MLKRLFCLSVSILLHVLFPSRLDKFWVVARPDERYTDLAVALVKYISLAEENREMSFFVCEFRVSNTIGRTGQRSELTQYSSTEEAPEHDNIDPEAEDIAEHDLRANRPPEEPEIARMPEETVYPIRNQLMRLLLLMLNLMVEIRARLCNRHTPHRLSYNRQPQPKPQHQRLRQYRWGEIRLPFGKVEACDCGFEEGGGVGGHVGPAVVEEEESGYGGVGEVEAGVGPELEEMEEGEAGEEEGWTP